MEFDDGEQDFSSLFTSFETNSSDTMSFLNPNSEIREEQPKLAKAEANALLFSYGSNSLFPNGEQMLSFSSSSSSSTPNALMVSNNGSLSSYPYHYNHPSSYSASPSASYYRNTGMILRSTNVSMHGMRGPFTPSQWMELEYQALIYKHIEANAPIPRNLLFPIWRSLNPSGLSTYPQSGPFRSVGWGSYNPGSSGNTDLEPGRCRRTDGKKWRCSRDTVADQKYCERHMNRGRHRSRKLVEGRSGQASPSAPVIASSSQSTSAGSSGPPLNGLNMDPSSSQFNRHLMRKENTNDHIQNSQALSLLTSQTPKPVNIFFPISKHHNPFEGTSSRADVALESSYSENIHLDDQNSQTYPLRHFIDDWPKSQDDHQQPITWPELDGTKSDGTDLSISIPTDSSQEKLALSPLRLSREFTPIKISWEPSIGGPLGEVLTNTNSNTKDIGKNFSSSSLNLLTDGWDLSSRLELSPTGVLQKTAFGSVSSSTGSSPRAENGKSNLCDDFLSTSLVSPLIVPSLQAL